MEMEYRFTIHPKYDIGDTIFCVLDRGESAHPLWDKRPRFQQIWGTIKKIEVKVDIVADGNRQHIVEQSISYLVDTGDKFLNEWEESDIPEQQ